MMWIPLTLSAVFICSYGLSLTELDYEDALSGDAALGRGVRPADEASSNRVARDVFDARGVSEIHYYKKGIICAGIHLKPWIVMTTGDCVYNMEVKKLYAMVTVPFGDALLKKMKVEVKSVTFHPKYKNGERRNNMALLLLYSQLDWNVGSLKMPQKKYIADELMRKKLPTWVFEFQQGVLKPVRMYVTNDTSVCGALSDAKGYYCVDRKGKPRTYNNDNLGIPLIYEKGRERVLLGHYTGIELDKHAHGHLFEEVSPVVYWVQEFVHEHPVPPDFPRE